MQSQLKCYAGFFPFLSGFPLTAMATRNAGLFRLLGCANAFPAGEQGVAAAMYKRLGEAGLICPLKSAEA